MVHAATIGIAGILGWDHFTLPMMMMFTKIITGYQAEILDQVLFHHPGPGEVLLGRKTLDRADTLSSYLIKGESNSECAAPTDKVICPVCKSNSFIIDPRNRNMLECPVCRTKATLSDPGTITWDESSMKTNRFSAQAGQEFVDNWILQTRDPFIKDHLKTILLSKQPYKDTKINIGWERPQ